MGTKDSITLDGIAVRTGTGLLLGDIVVDADDDKYYFWPDDIPDALNSERLRAIADLLDELNGESLTETFSTYGV